MKINYYCTLHYCKIQLVKHYSDILPSFATFFILVRNQKTKNTKIMKFVYSENHFVIMVIVMVYYNGKWRWMNWIMTTNRYNCFLFILPFCCYESDQDSKYFSNLYPFCEFEAGVLSFFWYDIIVFRLGKMGGSG